MLIFGKEIAKFALSQKNEEKPLGNRGIFSIPSSPIPLNYRDKTTKGF
jgi:hypothetical protein